MVVFMRRVMFFVVVCGFVILDLGIVLDRRIIFMFSDGCFVEGYVLNFFVIVY